VWLQGMALSMGDKINLSQKKSGKPLAAWTWHCGRLDMIKWWWTISAIRIQHCIAFCLQHHRNVRSFVNFV
jgi:hypothetical protein